MNVLNNIPTAYEGNEPYIFISYAHKDSARVFPFILKMQQAGLRVWFDKGIEAGSEWPEYIEKRLEDADSVVAFISAVSVASLNCRNEINLAFAEKKKMLVIYLEETELRHGMKLQLSSVQSMFAYDSANDEERVREVCDILGKKTTTPSVPPVQSAAPSPKSKKPMWIALAAAFVAICLCICLPLLLRETKTNTVLNEQYHATLVLNESDVSKDAVFLIKEISADGTLRAAIQKLSVNQSSYHVYDMSLWVDKTEIEIDGTVGITMPIPAGISEDKAVIYRILGETGEKVVSSVIDGKLSFTADKLGLYVIAERADSQSSENENEDDDNNGNTENNGGSSDTEEIPVTKTTILSFNANGGNGTMEAQTVTVGKASNLNTCTLTKVGYVFGGWATSADGDVAYMDGASFLTDSETATTLYAVWVPNTNSLVFHANGGVGSMSAVTVDTNETITLPANVFKRLGYTFKGWSTVKNGTVNYTDGQSFQMTASATVTLYAVWSANTYSVTLKANDGTEGEVTFSMKTDEMQNLPANTFTRKGYTFAGWSTTAVGSVEFTDKASYTMGSAAATLYAVWQPNANKIVFNANGGSGTMADQIVSTGAKANLNDCAFTYEGFIFAGWATAPDGNVAYANTASYTMGEEALYILYAIWTKSAYVITYQTNGGSNNLNNPVGYDVDTDTIVLADPTRDGYSFSGWYTESSLANKINTIPKGSTGHKTLYASWTANTNSINFNANGGSGVMSAQKAKTDEKVSLKQNAFTRSGYTFAGWSTSAEGNAVYKNGASYTVSSDASVTLYAVWMPNTYTLTYDLAGGTMTKTSQSVTFDASYILETPSRVGYTFKGWYNSGKKVEDGVWTLDGDMEITAKWTANAYTITYAGNQGTPSKPTDTVAYDSSITLATAERIGYTFAGWYYNGKRYESGVWKLAEDITLTAKWTANTDTKYTVNHHLQNLVDDKYMCDLSETFEGTSGSATTPAVKTYTGFASPKKQTVTIAPDGSLVVDYYYTRNYYTLTLVTNGGTGTTITQKYGSALDKDNWTTREGYTFGGWFTNATLLAPYTDLTMPAENRTIYAWWAEENRPTDFTYELSNEKIKITAYIGSNIRMSIPAYINNVPVATIPDSAFSGKSFIEVIGIPDTITTIGEYAFKDLNLLKKVVVPQSVTNIGVGAFMGCNSIEEITLPFVGASSNATYYKSVFGYIFGCEAVGHTGEVYNGSDKSSAGIKKVDYSYSSNKFINYIPYTSHKEDEAIWQYSCYDYYYNRNSYVKGYYYYIPKTLRSVTVTNQTIIPIAAFNGCCFIENVSLPDGVSDIGSHAFQNCNGLKRLNSLENGVFNIPVGVLTIKSYTFYECNEIVFISMPTQIDEIGEYAFYNCINVQSLTMPDTVANIGAYAFNGCTSISSLNGAISEFVLPENVITIGEYAFKDLNLLKKVVVPQSVTNIGVGAFMGCSAIEEITLPFVGESSTAQNYNAVFGYIFGYKKYGNNSTGYKVFNGSDKSYAGYKRSGSSSNAFLNYIPGETDTTCYSISGAVWQYSCYGYYHNRDYYVLGYYYYIPEALRSVTITNQIVIPTAAFNGCDFIEVINLPDTIESFGNCAFQNCNATIQYFSTED